MELKQLHDQSMDARIVNETITPETTADLQGERAEGEGGPLVTDDDGVTEPISTVAAAAPSSTTAKLFSRLELPPLSSSTTSNNLITPISATVAQLKQPSSPVRSTASSNRPFFFHKQSSLSSIHSPRSRHIHSRKVTRDIAALDFLQNIPMRSETIVHQNERKESHETESEQPSDDHSRTTRSKQNNAEEEETWNGSLAGRRLPGMDATMVRIPSLFRYRMTTKYPAASAVVRRWEASTAQQGVLDSRMYFSSGCGYPVATSTVIKYNGNEKSAIRKRLTSVGNLESISYDWRGKSYFRLLHATWTPCDKDRDSEDAHPEVVPYTPNYLDDPEFRQGRHRHVVRGDKNIGPIVSSILLFVKPNDLKEELNKKFQEKHTWLDADLSLSKIRNLKRETLISCRRLDLEVATAAIACLCFEKLVLSHYVTKSNRKLYMSVCLLLAAKFNEPKASDEMKDGIKRILAEIDQVHSISSREVLTAEFTVYAQLSFNLHVPLSEIQPHFTRLLTLIESNPRKYLDEDVFLSYTTLVLEEQKRNELKKLQAFDDGETPDEGTDMEALLSDEEEVGVDATEDELSAMFPWNRVSFAKWWKRRRSDSRRQDAPTPTPKST